MPSSTRPPAGCRCRGRSAARATAGGGRSPCGTPAPASTPAQEHRWPVEEATTSALAEGTGCAPAHTPAADPRPVRPAAGEGVGLSIVKRLCELLDATLELERGPGVGSTFRVRLPVRYD